MVVGSPPVEVLDEVDSTNRIISERLTAGCPHGTAVRARRQTAGRGRLGRTWVAPPDQNLSLSVALAGAAWQSVAPLVPLAAGLATATAVAQLTGVRPQLKWPNDLLVNGRKLAGILCEGATTPHRFAGIVVGIGLNVNIHTHTLPPDVSDRAASLLMLTGRPTDIDALATAVVRSLLTVCDWLRVGEAARVIEGWRTLDALAGQVITWTEAGAVRTGTADGIESTGALRVTTPTGLALLTAGEVTLRGG